MGRNKSSERDRHIKATIKDIANLAHVSETTVSLSFQPESRISERTRKKVLSIATQLNYYPNKFAQGLRSGRTRTIGFLINDIINPFYGAMVRTSQQIAMELGYEVVFAESQWSARQETLVIKSMLQSRIEGFILCFSEENDEAYKLVKASGLPHIVVDTRPKFYSGPYVMNDSVQVGYLAAKHLCSIGCRDVVMLNASREIGQFSSIGMIEEGVQRVLSQESVCMNSFTIRDSGLSILSGMMSFKELLASKQNFDGIFCMNDLCALGVMNAAIAHNITPGRDLAILGIDNNEISDLTMVSLSSVFIDYTTIADHATRYLINLIDRGNIPGMLEEVIEPKLIERDSTRGFLRA